MHSNVIRELQNNSLITIYKLSILLIHGNYNCMAPGFLEVAQHQLVMLVKKSIYLSDILSDVSDCF